MKKKIYILAAVVVIIAIAAAVIIIVNTDKQGTGKDNQLPGAAGAAGSDTDSVSAEPEVYVADNDEYTVELPAGFEYNEERSSDNMAIFSEAEDKSDMMCVLEYAVIDAEDPFGEVNQNYNMFGCLDDVEEIEINGYRALKVGYEAAGDGGKTLHVSDISIYIPEKNTVYQVSAVEPNPEDASDLHMMSKVEEAAMSLTVNQNQ